MGGSCRLLALPEYRPEYNAKLSDEILAADPTAAWPDAIEDYRALRGAVRACTGAA